MELSKRLSAVAAMVLPCASMADIGTDHGYLPIELVKNGTVGSAYACDVRTGPLSRAEAHIRREGLSDRIGTVLSDGLEALPAPVDTVVMAGMGGALMAELLSSAKAQAPLIRANAARFVLQPQSEPELVRKAVYDLDLHIEKEDMVLDRGKYYLILSAVPGRDEREAASLRFGTYLSENRHPVFREYLEKELQKNKNLSAKLSNRDSEASRARVSALSEEAQAIEKELAKW